MVKRLTAMTMLLLLLTGCGVQEEVETTDTTATTEPTQPSGYYMQESPVEQSTDGAVRQYQLPQQVYPVIASMGDKLLLIAKGDRPEMILLQGEDAVPVNCGLLPEGFDLETDAFRVTHYGVVYYDAAAKEMVYLDPQLQESGRIALPGEMTGQPVLSPDGNEIFYCVGAQVYAVDGQQGATRPVRSFACLQVTLLDCLFDGQLLACLLKEEGGEEQTIYISAQTGETRSKEQGLLRLESWADCYFALRMDGTVEQQIVGAWDSEPMALSKLGGTLIPVLPLDGVACWSAGEGALQLSFRRLGISGNTVVASDSGVSLTDVGEPVASLGEAGYLWLLTAKAETGEQSLLRWELGESPEDVTESCVAPLFTAETPDAEGLKVCQDRVDSLNKTYGVRIRIWQDAAKYSNTEVLEPEYQTYAINRTLDTLETVFPLFPEKFLANCVNDRIRICIVRTVDGEVEGTQYWNDGDAFIVLSAGGDIQNDFLKGLGYLVDSHVLGNSPNYDYWNATNPEGFVYGDSATYSPDYLTGETRAFVDEVGMTSVTEDRSRLFWEAMRPGNEELFGSPVMQEKLRQLCLAIRDAWRLERKTEVYTWEQYLQASIAYQG